MTDTPPGVGLPQALSPEQATALAKAHGLKPLGARPPFVDYCRQLWRRRSFVWTLSSAEAEEKTSQDRLGILWTVLNPILLIISYFLIFGLLMNTRHDSSNFIGFLTIGVIIYGFSSAAMTRGTKAIVGNTSLVRALRFPRAILPLSTTLTEGLMTAPALIVLIALMLFTHEPLTWHWLLLPVALALQTLILAGLVMMGARLLNISRDLGNLIPVMIRLLRYVSGVFFSIQHRTRNHEIISAILEFQPFALPITLVRQCLMKEYPLVWSYWGIAALWAIGLFVAGLWLFWVDEAKYGRG
ncbi:MAG: ABC transporter permease [Tetrasphaera sp.]